MQIVIDVQNEEVPNKQEIIDVSLHFIEGEVCECTYPYIVLPKGHGRLIDYGYVVDAIDDWVNAGEYNYTNATDYLRNRIRNVLTIIEADKAESEVEE